MILFALLMSTLYIWCVLKIHQSWTWVCSSVAFADLPFPPVKRVFIILLYWALNNCSGIVCLFFILFNLALLLLGLSCLCVCVCVCVSICVICPSGLAYCRHLSTVRTHLSALVNHNIVPPDRPCEASGGLSKEVWSKYQKDCKVGTDRTLHYIWDHDGKLPE